MSENNFYTAAEMKPLYNKIVPVYQAAFAGEPWYEVSKCADVAQRCVGGLSKIAVGSLCGTCGVRPTQTAYPSEELTVQFEQLASTRPTEWYIEREPSGIALAAIAWSASPKRVAAEKYADVPVMGNWLPEQLGERSIVWLDEVFADKAVRPSGNLANFASMNRSFMARLTCNTLAFRTINPRMITAARSGFGEQATVFTAEQDVPDRRSLVIIRTDGEV